MSTAESRPGLVIARHGAQVMVEDPDTGTLQACITRRKMGPVVCGDRVRWRPQPHGPGVVDAVSPRRSLLSRPDPRGRLKPVCANVDLLVVVNAPFFRTAAAAAGGQETAVSLNLDLLDRYLVAAELSGIGALVVVNKIDLVNGGARSMLNQILEPYRAMAYPTVYTSTVNDDGLEALQEHLVGHTSVLVGESGVGKSSLVQALLPDLDIRIGEIAAASGKGRHTTTTTTLYHLPRGGDLIDSPGVRDFGLWHITPEELARGFRDFAPWRDHCRFRNCRHAGEAGCAVEEAARKGAIDPQRLERYRQILLAMEQGPHRPGKHRK